MWGGEREEEDEEQRKKEMGVGGSCLEEEENGPGANYKKYPSLPFFFGFKLTEYLTTLF